MLHRMGINHIFTSVSHPCANGAVERLVRTLKESLKKHLDSDVQNWPSSLPSPSTTRVFKTGPATFNRTPQLQDPSNFLSELQVEFLHGDPVSPNFWGLPADSGLRNADARLKPGDDPLQFNPSECLRNNDECLTILLRSSLPLLRACADNESRITQLCGLYGGACTRHNTAPTQP